MKHRSREWRGEREAGALFLHTWRWWLFLAPFPETPQQPPELVGAAEAAEDAGEAAGGSVAQEEEEVGEADGAAAAEGEHEGASNPGTPVLGTTWSSFSG